MVNRVVVVGIGLLLLAGCSSSSQASAPSGSPSGSAGPTGDSGGNGTLFTSLQDISAGTVAITSHPIGEDGSIGDATPLLSGPADDTILPGVIDGVGPSALTGSFTNYWTTDLQVRSADKVSAEVAAPRWCGGEGLTANVCTLLDSTRVARTSELGGEPEAGDSATGGSVTVSSLTDGATMDTFGPFEDLTMMLGTRAPDQVLLVMTPQGPDEGSAMASTVKRLDLTDGTTTDLGNSPVGWVPLCAIGPDSVLGFTSDGQSTAAVVGSAQVADLTWEDKDSVVGCSADGRFLYLQRIPQPPTEEVEDTEGPNPPTVVEKVTLADSSRGEALLLAAGEIAGPIGR